MVTKQTVVGADLSHHNPNPELKKAKANGLQWLIHKATEGSTYTDPTYAARRQQAKKAGLLFGAYHFARPDTDGKDAKLEALHCFKVAKPVAGDLVPTLDYEVAENYKGDDEKWCKEFMAELGRLLKLKGLGVHRGIHYGPDDFGKDYQHLRWVPRYNSQNTPPTVPYDWFQFSNGRSGVPNYYNGLGNVDLNSYAPGFDRNEVKRVTLQPLKAAPEAPKKEYVDLVTMHFSMQYSDNAKQHAFDTEKIFKHARSRNAAWFTGTESSEREWWAMIVEAADKYGYKLHQNRGNFVAVDKEIIKKGSWLTGDVFVMDNDKVVGPGHDSDFPWVTFQHKNERIGTISVAAIHYPTKGRTPSDPNHWVNKLYAEVLGKWALAKGKGAALVFVGGDFNMADNKQLDLFFDQPLTTYGDELGRWPNTGHGPIDAMATYDPDVRVECTGYNVLDDKKFFLHTDHFGIQGRVKVELLKAA